MDKVIVERPRRGGDRARKGRPPRDLEDQPAKEGIGRPYRTDSKSLNEHLGPLRRFLRKQVGRPWNKVYSEICEGLRAGHPLHDHVRRHLFESYSVRRPHAATHLSRFLRSLGHASRRNRASASFPSRNRIKAGRLAH